MLSRRRHPRARKHLHRHGGVALPREPARHHPRDVQPARGRQGRSRRQSVPQTWTRGVVESSFRQAHYGEVYHEPPVRSRVGVTPVRESIYIDTGEWLYHVSQLVTTRGMANLREGDKVEVAVKGKSLIL